MVNYKNIKGQEGFEEDQDHAQDLMIEKKGTIGAQARAVTRKEVVDISERNKEKIDREIRTRRKRRSTKRQEDLHLIHDVKQIINL